MLAYPDDTIVALATAPGNSALAVVRLSGPRALEIADHCFEGKRPLTRVSTHTLHYGRVLDQEGQWIDEVVAAVYHEPHSYSGENSVEFSCHGGGYVASRVVAVLLAAGARAAEPGEFTRRAFLNGRLDLVQAEAVVDIIHAAGEAALRGARNQLDGLLSRKVETLRKSLTEAAALLELELDFAEQDIELIPYTELEAKISTVISELDTLLAGYRYGKVVRDGVQVVLVGMPNVGKSSLLNYFLKEERAIVSHLPGTTRDVIREDLLIEGFLFRLSDTAGLRETADHVESEGVARTLAAAHGADLVLCMAENTEQLQRTIEMLGEKVPRNRIVTVINKIDQHTPPPGSCDVAVSVLKGWGMDDILHALKEHALGNWQYSEQSALVCNARHYAALERAREALYLTRRSLQEQASNELVAVDLREAMDALGEIIGVISSDSILDEVFQNFCIGK